MKETLRRELTNIVFLVLIVAAAVAIYLLSRAETKTLSPDATQTPAVNSAPVQSGEEVATEDGAEPSGSPEPKPTTHGVPESVFRTHLLSSELYSAEQKRGQKTAYTITVEGEPPIEAALIYELLDGCVSSLELTFQLLDTNQRKSDLDIDAYIQEYSENLSAANAEAIPALLSDLLLASDADGELQQASIRLWTDEALLLKKPGAKFEDTQNGYHFVAYRRQAELYQELVCVLFLT